jgi:hypothetical protein
MMNARVGFLRRFKNQPKYGLKNIASKTPKTTGTNAGAARSTTLNKTQQIPRTNAPTRVTATDVTPAATHFL